MGIGTQPRTLRNLRIYKDYVSGKKNKSALLVKHNISIRRFYQIIEWSKKYLSENPNTSVHIGA